MEEENSLNGNGIEATPVQDKTLSQERLDEIIKREKAAAAEKVRREMAAQHQAEMEAMKAQASGVGGMGAINQDEILAQIEERLMQKAQAQYDQQQLAQRRAEMEDIASQYVSKMSLGSQLYDDFDSVVADFNPSAFPQLVYLASKFDNLPAIMYDLAQNPKKIADIDYMAQRDPKLAEKMLSQLSQSIAANEKAKEAHQTAKSPLSMIKPSATAGADNGRMTVRDYKKAPWLKA